MPNTLQAEKQITQARLYLLNHRVEKALMLLTTPKLNNTLLNTYQTIQRHRLLADIYQAQNKQLNSLAERNLNYVLLSSPKRKKNNPIDHLGKLAIYFDPSTSTVT